MPTRSLHRATSVVVVSAALALSARAQLVEAWARSDASFPVATFSVAPDGRNVIAGTWYTPYARALLRDAAGSTIGNITFDLGASSNEFFQASAFAANGDVLLAGRIENQSPPHPGLVTRYDGSGVLVWSQTLPPTGSGQMWPSLVAPAPNGDIVVAGNGGDDTTMGRDVIVWRVDAQGNVLWRGIAGTPTWDSAKAVAVAANGDVVVAGSGNDNFLYNSDVFVARFSAGGSLSWSHIVPGGTGIESAVSVAIDPAGRTFVAGKTATGTGSGGTTFESLLLAYAADGTLLWSRSTTWPDGVQVGVDAHGDVLFLSGAFDSGAGYELRKYDTSGNLLWSVTRASSNPWGFVVEAGDDVLVHGAHFAPVPQADALAVRYDRAGTTRWTTTYGLPGDSYEVIRKAGADTGGSIYAFDMLGLSSTVRRFGQASRSVCFGDGAGAACPCANESAPGDQSGCRHSLGVGARLQSAGRPSLSLDSVRLDVTSATNASVLFFQGDGATAGGAGAPFGDGLRCASGNVVRIATRTASSGAVSYPAGPGDATVSVRGAIGAPGTRWYQAWFRNSASFCTPATFNTTNGVAIDWSA